MGLAVGTPNLMQRLPAFHRLQTSAFCAGDSLDCFPSLINTSSIEELLLDGVAATYRMHPGLRQVRLPRLIELLKTPFFVRIAKFGSWVGEIVSEVGDSHPELGISAIVFTVQSLGSLG